ncbi:MAG: SPASM domain-containing protein [Lachnospiraceae bacterium]|nr:SPASM domain-containing protein [Lachnospiraceae bacterium]
MIYNRYEEKSLRSWARQFTDKHPRLFDFLFRIVIKRTLNKLKKRDFPCLIELETVNRCNNVCSFCPASKDNDIREFAKMDAGLFQRIIDDLQQSDYRGVLGLYSNNEPLLDERLADWAKTAKESLPKAHIVLFTNGTLLTPELFQRLIPYIDEMIIDNYSDSLKMIKPVSEVYDNCIKDTEYEKKVIIHIRKLNEVLNTHGGSAPNADPQTAIIPKNTCLLPFAQCVIRPDGKISLCCNDAYGKYTLGDLNKQSISEVWNGRPFNELRERLKKGRQSIDKCSVCDNRLMSISYIRKGLRGER